MSPLSELLPVPDLASRPFFDAALEGRLMLQRCTGCAQAWFPFRSRCAVCNGPGLEWEVASGKGRIYMHGRMHQVFHPELAEAAIVLRRSCMIGGVRFFDLDQVSMAPEMGDLRGRCFTYSQGNVERAYRVRGTRRDFSHDHSPMLGPEPASKG